MGEFAVTFLPAGKKVICVGGERLIEVAQQNGVRIAADCGAGAGAGVRRLLVCGSAREKARSLALKTQYLELATQPGFHGTFARRAAF